MIGKLLGKTLGFTLTRPATWTAEFREEFTKIAGSSGLSEEQIAKVLSKVDTRLKKAEEAIVQARKKGQEILAAAVAKRDALVAERQQLTFLRDNREAVDVLDARDVMEVMASQIESIQEGDVEEHLTPPTPDSPTPMRDEKGRFKA